MHPSTILVLLLLGSLPAKKRYLDFSHVFAMIYKYHSHFSI